MEHQVAERSGTNRPRVGERLAAERAAQGLALTDIAARTRVPLRSLEALEAGSSEGLPALTYAAGFVRSYAQALGLDGAEYAQQYRAESGRAPAPYVPEEYQLADPARVPTRLLAIVALIVALLIAGAYAIVRGDGLFGGGATDRARLAAGTDMATGAVTPAPAAPVVAGNAPPPAPVPATGPVVVGASAPVWLKIYERDGRTLYMDTMQPGARFEIPAGAVDPLLRTGRAQALTITVGGRPVPTLGPPDVLVKDRSLAPAALTGAPAVSTGAPAGAIVPLVPPPAAGGAPAGRSAGE